MPSAISVALLTHAAGAHVGNYLSALAETDEVESVVLSDPDGKWEAATRAALGSKPLRVYRNHDEALRAERPKLALVTYEARLAPPVIDAALSAGCHVLAEKPSCTAAADFAKLAAKADSKHLHLMLALANRVRPEILEAKRMLAAGTFGRRYGMELHLVADQKRLKNPAYHKGWFAQKDRAGGGHLIWLGIHWLDLAMHISGAKIEDVAAFTANVGGQPLDVEDSAAVTMRFDDGSLGTMTSGYYLDRGYHSHIKIWGERGWLQLEPRGTPGLWWQVYDDPKNPGIQKFAERATPSSYQPFVQAAVRAATELDEPPISNAESLRALQTVFACYRAAETGSRQRVGK